MAAEVIVAGAGLAGLTAARRLQSAGVRVIVLEARDRVGGRTLSRPFGKSAIDLGAQWIGPGQDRMAGLAQEFGIEVYAQPVLGRQILSIENRQSSYEGTIPSLPPHALLELHLRITQLERQCRRVPLLKPWEAPEAAEWDSMSVEYWKRRVLTRGARKSLDAVVNAIFACEPSEISFLYFMHYLHSGGGLMRLADVKGGAQQDKFVGGMQQVSKRIASSLSKSVHLSMPVHAVAQTRAGVTVYAGKNKGRAFKARYAIFAMPPGLCSQIRFDPDPGSLRQGLTARMAMGSVIKCFARYDRPFWRDGGFSGEAVSDGDGIRLTFDASVPGTNQYALVGFMPGSAARTWSDRPAERRARVLGDFARLFGRQALEPVEYVDQDWIKEPFSRGCYAGILGPGVLTQFGSALRDPVGRIHFAGTETAEHWTGYMEGAVRSGERAALEILSRL